MENKEGILMYDEYIEKQLVEISKWEQQKPSVVNTGMNKIFSPMSKFTRKVIPEVVVEKAIYHAMILVKN